MAQNPLLGNRISLISKKSIRYEGTLYSINESDATVALADVRSYGTEGREKLDPSVSHVPPQDAVHPFLLFRGSDIKDLHVHENQEEKQKPPKVDKKKEETKPEEEDAKVLKGDSINSEIPKENTSPKHNNKTPTKHADNHKDRPQQRNQQSQPRPSQPRPTQPPAPKSSEKPSKPGFSRRPRKFDSKVGTGASLLTRKARGAVEGADGPKITSEDFDFESSTAAFQSKQEEITESHSSSEEETPVYVKDNFFDCISCDAIDKRDGTDNRLRGSDERTLNTETFGAVSLGTGRRGGRRYYRRRGGGGGGGGRGRGQGGREPNNQGRVYNSNWNSSNSHRENYRWRRQEGVGNRDNKPNFHSRPPNATSQAPTARAGGDR